MLLKLMKEVKLVSTGACVPEKIVTNRDLEACVDTSDEWIRTRTGICERRVAVEENLTTLAAAAAREALARAHMAPEALDMIIVATLTPDTPLPNASARVQKALGARNAVCFDVSAACSGFVFAMNTAAMYIRSGAVKNALVIGAEILSRIVDWKDRSTCILFGDGAGAAILSESEIPGLLGMDMGSDGDRGEHLTLYDRFVAMNGAEIFKFAVKRVPESILAVLEKENMTAEDVDHFVLHQANYRIIEAVSKRLGAALEKFVVNLDRYGNTSAASIPIALDELVCSKKVKTGDILVISGFGGGLTWGSVLLRVLE